MKDEKGLATSKKIELTRYLHTQKHIRDLYGKQEDPVSLKDRFLGLFTCSRQSFIKSFLGFIPFLTVLRTYKVRKYLLDDILSGITVTCLHFPQGLAFGILASLTPEFGLYTSFFSIAFYMIFGTSHHTSFGTNPVIALFTAEMARAQVAGLTRMTPMTNLTGNGSHLTDVFDDDSILEIKVMAASGATMIVGILLFAMGILRLGFLTSYMSSSFIHAFVCASAFHIATSQIPKALGITIPLFTGPGKLVLSYVAIFKAIPQINVASLIITILSITVLLLVKECINKRFKDKMKMPIPIDLILIIVATTISNFSKLKETYSVPVVGHIPSGIPAPRLPLLNADLLNTSVIVAVIVFVLSIAMARTCEMKHDYQIDDNQELIAYGLANLGSSFFQCFPSCTAPARTMLLSVMNARTTVNGFFSAIVMLLVLLVIGPLFTSLPLPVISAMVIIAVKDLLLHVTEIPKFWRTNRYDFVIWMGTCLCGVFIDIPYALYAGVGLGLFTVVAQSQRSVSYTLRPPETEEDIYLDSSTHVNLRQVPNIRIFRMESSLYFATADIFKRSLYAAVGDPRKVVNSIEMETKDAAETHFNTVNSDPVQNDTSEVTGRVKFVIIDCSLVSYVDMNGMNILTQISKDFRKVNVAIVLARCSRYMQICLGKSLLSGAFPDDSVFLDLNDAVYACSNGIVTV